MKVLEPIQNKFILIWFCSTANSSIKFRNILGFSVTSFVTVVTCVLSSAAYVPNNWENDLEGCLSATTFFLGSLSLAIMMISAYTLRYKISEVFADYQNVYDKYKELDSGKFLQKANERSARFTNYGVYFMSTCTATNTFLIVFSLIYSFYEFGRANLEILYRPFKFGLPWNQNCLLGWIGEGAFSILVTSICIFIAVMFCALFISFLFFNVAFYQFYRSQFEKIDLMPHSTPCQSYKVKKVLFDSILFHISAKELFKKTAQVYGSFILIFLGNTMIFLALSVFQLDFAFRHLDITFFIMFEAFLYGLAQLYAYCYVGKYSTDYFLAFADRLFESNWMTLPMELQRSIPFMIANAQIPLYYHGSHMVVLSLELFLKMMKTVLSYYIMFKTLVDL